MSAGTVLLLGFKVESFLSYVAYSTLTPVQEPSANFASQQDSALQWMPALAQVNRALSSRIRQNHAAG